MLTSTTAKIPIRCFRFDVEEKLANHLNYFREVGYILLTPLLLLSFVFSCLTLLQRLGITKHVPRIGYNMYKKNFKEPELSEGFSEIKKIRFVASFDNPDHEKLFQQQA